MGFDALTLAAVRDELQPLLEGSRVQRLVMVDELSLALECFTPGAGRLNVLLSADLERARVQRIGQLPSRGLERESPFSLLVRKHLRNARIRSVHQPRLERVFEVHCEQRDAASDRPYRVALILEAMGRRSNLVLVDAEGLIIDAARRTPPSRSRRPVLPHLPYQPPPPQDRLWPEDLAPASLIGPDPPEKILAQRVAGLSPLAAREIAFRASGGNLREVTRDFLGIVDRHDWSPTVAFDGNAPVEYAPYELTHLASRARIEQFEAISQAMGVFYAQAHARRRGDPLAGERKALLAILDRAAHQAHRRIGALEHQFSNADPDTLRRAGELLLAHQTEIPPSATETTLDGEGIPLDADLTPVENAQAYFAKYRRARETQQRVPQLLEEARHEAEHLAQLHTLVEVADNMDAIRALRRDVAVAVGKREPTSARKASQFQRVPLGNGWEALFGTSATGNAAVTFDLGSGDDLWLHARGVPGAHVILRGHGEPPTDVLERAAQIAAQRSAARNSNAVEVDVTRRRYVKKVPQGPPGLVRYTHERTVRVASSLL